MSSRSVDAHRADAPDSVRCAVLTVSDTRSPDSDTSGTLIRETLKFSGHSVVDYRIVPDEPDQIREILEGWIGRDDVQVVLTNGGTGIAARDTTYDAISSMLDKRIDGFGELFRMLSWQEIGAAAMLSRAIAGVAGQTLIVAMPGSTNAVRLALTKLIVPELGHLVYEIAK
ncbi:MAG TPA: MogA/MoaB family molybdenum cofactor biosynthesis protein [Thermomicrobiales bacterium]|nr:MogA/MoaB family molybdenum cofactor biosynthesis protein [Thermomicrobiales bacterium]